MSPLLTCKAGGLKDKEDPHAKLSGQLMTASISVPQGQKEMTEGYDNSLL